MSQRSPRMRFQLQQAERKRIGRACSDSLLFRELLVGGSSSVSIQILGRCIAFLGYGLQTQIPTLVNHAVRAGVLSL